MIDGVRIPLVNGGVTYVDADTAITLDGVELRRTPQKYATTCGKRHVLLHRLVMNAPSGSVVDHINGDKLDNRRANLRVCSSRENMRHRNALPSNNKTGIMGGYFDRRTGRIVVQIHTGERTITVGTYATLREATIARHAAERVLWQGYASTMASEAG